MANADSEHMAATSSPTVATNEASAWPQPYYAVIFTSIRPAQATATGGEASAPQGDSQPGRAATITAAAVDDEYAATAHALFQLAAQQPGYLGQESHHTVHVDGSTRGVTVSYWTDPASIRAWRAVTEHAAARERGRNEWYKAWHIRVAKVEREYGAGSWEHGL